MTYRVLKKTHNKPHEETTNKKGAGLQRAGPKTLTGTRTELKLKYWL